MHAAVDLVSQNLMYALGNLVVDADIRRDLKTPMAARPVFSYRHKFPAYAPVSVVFNDVPTLDLAHGPSRIATVRVGAQVDFQEANDRPIPRLGDQDDKWRCHRWLPIQNRGKLSGVFFGGAVGPSASRKRTSWLRSDC
jgi:hypothetical protein